MAVKWASAQKDVGGALDLVMALDAARQDLADSLNVIARIDALLQRGGGLDAVPMARDGWISADAIENGSMQLRGQIADRAAELAAPLLSPGRSRPAGGAAHGAPVAAATPRVPAADHRRRWSPAPGGCGPG